MANAGIEIINTWGTVLIDDKSPVISLRNKYTYTPVGIFDYTRTVVINDVVLPIFAIKSSNWCYIVSTVRSGNTVTITFGGYLDTPSLITLYYFDVTTTTAGSSGLGLQVFNSSGQCMFDSNQKNAIVVQDVTADTTFTGTSGREYAYGCYSGYHRIYQSQRTLDYYDEERFVNACKMTGSNVQVDTDMLYYSDYNVPGSDMYLDQATGFTGGLILDVTGY